MIPANLAIHIKPAAPRRPEHQLLLQYSREIRRITIASIYRAGSGHPGGSLSCADLLAALYGTELYIPREDPHNEGRDRFILSKGHAAPALYAAWTVAGLLPLETALSLRQLGSRAQGYPHVLDMPLSESTTGSLGQGFSVAIGMALGLQMKRRPSRVYVLLGDGECQEGQVWEAAMCAAHYQLSNLCALVDYNKLQSDDRTTAIMGVEPLAAKWRAFGWTVHEIDGHDMGQILGALNKIRQSNGPNVIIAHTIKGRGVCFMEDQPSWHGSVKLTADQAREALEMLDTNPSLITELLDGSPS